MANFTEVAAVPQLTNKAGEPTPQAMGMQAPHTKGQDGFEIEDYGNDKEAAFKHYNGLVAARRRKLGTKTNHIAPGFVM